MDWPEKRRRAVDLKALGLAVVAGLMIARADKAGRLWVVAMVGVATGCYYWGTEWEDAE